MMEVRIYRCCPNCGKGDTPLSRRRHCEVCGGVLPVIGGSDHYLHGPGIGDGEMNGNEQNQRAHPKVYTKRKAGWDALLGDEAGGRCKVIRG